MRPPGCRILPGPETPQGARAGGSRAQDDGQCSVTLTTEHGLHRKCRTARGQCDGRRGVMKTRERGRWASPVAAWVGAVS